MASLSVTCCAREQTDDTKNAHRVQIRRVCPDLTASRPRPYDGNMVKAIPQLLALAGSFLLLLPPGWCCRAIASECHGSSCAAGASRSPSPKAGCCHHQQSAKSEESPAPTKPVVPACCERQPTMASDSRWQLPDLAVAPMVPAIEATRTIPSARDGVDSCLVFPANSLHVLHCVWLC
jgi:hypothetical protein